MLMTEFLTNVLAAVTNNFVAANEAEHSKII
jgi:hypothetical protein